MDGYLNLVDSAEKLAIYDADIDIRHNFTGSWANNVFWRKDSGKQRWIESIH